MTSEDHAGLIRGSTSLPSNDDSGLYIFFSMHPQMSGNLTSPQVLLVLSAPSPWSGCKPLPSGPILWAGPELQRPRNASMAGRQRVPLCIREPRPSFGMAADMDRFPTPGTRLSGVQGAKFLLGTCR